MATRNPFEQDLERNAANYTPLSPLSLIARTAVRLSAAARRGARRPPLHLGRDVRALAAACLRARAGGHRRWRHGCADGGEHAGNGRGAFRRADERRRAQHAEHAARRRRHRVHAAARRRQGADHRHRIRADHRACAGATRDQADSDRHRRPARARRQATGRGRLRALHRRRRPRLRMAASRRRVECDLAQLHVGHHRQSEGRRLPPPRRVPERAVEHHRLGHAAARGVSVDAADVPLQRLVLPVDDGRQRRHQRLPAPGRSQGDLRRDPRAQGHPLLRRADRARDADQRARGSCARASRTRCTRWSRRPRRRRR